MKISQFQNREEWLDARGGKVTGSKLSDLVVNRGTGKKKGFYELIAERIATKPDDEKPMDRGHRLEGEAIQKFMEDTGKLVDTSLVMWQRDDDDSIAISPDGFISEGERIEEAVEVKCFDSANHIKAFLTQEIPSDYQYQKIQYFVVNPNLQKLNFVFYDPRIPCKPYFVIEVYREEVQAEVDEMLELQKTTLAEIDEIVNRLTNF